MNFFKWISQIYNNPSIEKANSFTKYSFQVNIILIVYTISKPVFIFRMNIVENIFNFHTAEYKQTKFNIFADLGGNAPQYWSKNVMKYFRKVKMGRNKVWQTMYLAFISNNFGCFIHLRMYLANECKFTLNIFFMPLSIGSNKIFSFSLKSIYIYMNILLFSS